jgi:hypothetical protein
MHVSGSASSFLRALGLFAPSSTVAACSGGTSPADGGVDAFEASTLDTGPITDAGVAADSPAVEDAARADDAAAPSDAGAFDAGMCMPRAPLGVTPCRGDSDCSAGAAERCRNPDERPGCGICMDPPRDCATDPDCPSMDGLQYVCEQAEVSCPCSGDGLGTFCLAPCSVTGCEDGWTCGSSGHCEADSCDAGYACALGTTCGTAGAVGDAHGCVRTSCAVDADCPCGAGCVEGLCFDVLGTCEGPRA